MNTFIFSKNMLDCLPVGFAVLRSSEEHEILYANQACCSLFGYAPDEFALISQNFHHIMENVNFLDFCQKYQAELESGKPVEEHFQIRRKDQLLIWVRIRISCPDKIMGHIYMTLCDATHEKNLERQLYHQVEKYKLLTEKNSLLTFDYSIEEDVLLYEVYTESHQVESYTLTHFLETIRSSTLLNKKYISQYEHYIHAALQEKGSKKVELRGDFFLLPHSWVRAEYDAIQDSQGQVYRILGRVIDISREKAVEEQLAQEQRIRKTLLSNAIAIYKFDLSSGEYELIFENTNEHSAFYPWSFYWYTHNPDAIHPDDLPQVRQKFALEHLYEKVRQGIFELQLIYRIQTMDGQWNWMENVIHLTQEEDGRITGLFYLSDVNKEVIWEKELLETAQHDSLTGLLNRSAFKEKVNHILSNSLHTTCHAFLMVDVDNFKSINDAHGHGTGDTVICGIANILKASFRERDYACRMGGDEFSVFMTDISSPSSLEARIQNLIEEVRQLGASLNFICSVSIGVSLFPEHARSFDELYKRADDALYQVKKGCKGTYLTLPYTSIACFK